MSQTRGADTRVCRVGSCADVRRTGTNLPRTETSLRPPEGTGMFRPVEENT